MKAIIILLSVGLTVLSKEHNEKKINSIVFTGHQEPVHVKAEQIAILKRKMHISIEKMLRTLGNPVGLIERKVSPVFLYKGHGEVLYGIYVTPKKEQGQRKWIDTHEVSAIAIILDINNDREILDVWRRPAMDKQNMEHKNMDRQYNY